MENWRDEEKKIADSYTWSDKEKPGNYVNAIGPMLDKLANRRAQNFKSKSDKKDIIDSEILRIRLDELLHYQKHYWSIFKWMFVTSLILLMLPFSDAAFTLAWAPQYKDFLQMAFPLTSVIVSALSLVIVKIESTEVQRLRLSLRSLMIALKPQYDDFPKQYFTKQPMFYYFVKYDSVNMTIWFYIAIAVLAISEQIYFIIRGNGIISVIGLIVTAVIVLGILFFIIYFRRKFKAEGIS